MSRALLSALLLAAIAAPASALAQDAEGDRQIKYKDRTVIDFESVDVSGELKKPSGVLLMDVKKTSFNPLIRFREDFDREMRESIDEVK